MYFVDIKHYGSVAIEANSTYEDAVSLLRDDRPVITAVKVAGRLRELSHKVEWSLLEKGHSVHPVDMTSPDGERIYQRSLLFLLIKAAHDLFPNIAVKVSHSLGRGLYIQMNMQGIPLTHRDVLAVKSHMKQLAERNLPIVAHEFTLEEAAEIFHKQNMEYKAELLKYRHQNAITLYEIDRFYDYFYGYMLPRLGYLKEFDLLKYNKGVILMHPTRFSPDSVPEFEEFPKLSEVFDESDAWLKIMGISYVYNLNRIVEEGKSGELIRIAEALHEKKIAQIADEITRRNKRVILIAGPSSSGKTTFANRLRTQLQVNGLHPVTISTDDYFVNREDTPKNPDGSYDFESIDALDLKYFNKDLKDLLDGQKVDMPSFNFLTGLREYRGKVLQIREHQPIIIEGIHGLNDRLTKQIHRIDKYKIYISSLTQLNIDEHNRIPTTQSRLLRRIVRDSKFRGNTAAETISMWQSIRAGEEKYIFPYQEEADAIFNSSLPYELSVLKKHALPLLEEIRPDRKEFSEALLLRKFLSYFVDIEHDNLTPSVSILKEFIGGSAFDTME